MAFEAPDDREDEDCPGPEVCEYRCDQHVVLTGQVPVGEPE